MPTSLKARLLTGAMAFPALAALLASSPSPLVLRWFDTQLPQGARFPCVVVQQISNPRTYAVTGRLPTGFTRMQFTVYGAGNDSQNANDVVTALVAFLDQWDGGSGIVGLPAYSNIIVGDKDAGVANTQPLTYTRIIDAQIFSSDEV